MATVTELVHTWSLGVKNDSGSQVVADQYVFLGDSEENIKDQVAAGSTLEVDMTVVTAKIVSFYLWSDQAVTLKLNSATSPDQTINLAAKTAFAWNNGSFANIGANPLTPATITKFFFVNAGTAVANVRGGFLLNQ